MSTAFEHNNKKRVYVTPQIDIIALEEECQLMAGSASNRGWTTTNIPGGYGIVEENKDNAYSDDSFGAKEWDSSLDFDLPFEI